MHVQRYLVMLFTDNVQSRNTLAVSARLSTSFLHLRHSNNFVTMASVTRTCAGQAHVAYLMLFLLVPHCHRPTSSEIWHQCHFNITHTKPLH